MIDEKNEPQAFTTAEKVIYALLGLTVGLSVICSLCVVFVSITEPENYGVLGLTVAPALAAGVAFALIYGRRQMAVGPWRLGAAVLMTTAALLLIGTGITAIAGATEPNLISESIEDATLVCFTPGICLIILVLPLYFGGKLFKMITASQEDEAYLED